MFSKLISILLLASFVTAQEHDDREKISSCYGECVKQESIPKWKKCTDGCYGNSIEVITVMFIICEERCVKTFFSPENDNSKNPKLTSCTDQCVKDYRQ